MWWRITGLLSQNNPRLRRYLSDYFGPKEARPSKKASLLRVLSSHLYYSTRKKTNRLVESG